MVFRPPSTVVLLGLSTLAAWAGCTSRDMPARSERTADECSNGDDDDRDGVADCADPACSVHTYCGGTGDAGPGDGDAGTPTDSGPRPDVTTPLCTDPIDVVFVLDVSTSMDDDAARMRDGIESIWNAAMALTPDTRFGLVVFVDDALAEGGCSSFADLATLRARFDHWRAFCASNASPVSGEQNSDCPENSLDALHLAATTCTWRPGATHIIVHVTDDTFVERPGVLSEPVFGPGGIPVQHTYAEVAAELVTRELRMGVFAAPGAGDFCGAGSSPNTGQGFHEPYMGMTSLPMQTGGRAWDIRAVRSGSLDMAVAVTELIEAEHCTLF